MNGGLQGAARIDPGSYGPKVQRIYDLVKNRPRWINELVRLTGFDPGTVTRICNYLGERGFFGMQEITDDLYKYAGDGVQYMPYHLWAHKNAIHADIDEVVQDIVAISTISRISTEMMEQALGDAAKRAFGGMYGETEARQVLAQLVQTLKSQGITYKEMSEMLGISERHLRRLRPIGGERRGVTPELLQRMKETAEAFGFEPEVPAAIETSSYDSNAADLLVRPLRLQFEISCCFENPISMDYVLTKRKRYPGLFLIVLSPNIEPSALSAIRKHSIGDTRWEQFPPHGNGFPIFEGGNGYYAELWSSVGPRDISDLFTKHARKVNLIDYGTTVNQLARVLKQYRDFRW